ncbi:protein of unknown function [Vibrio tapetis subsp. tapetis]|uniref:Uncharacterized protein n=1 Tax=Vibrio tapetis subsp. tapetis TaxID=1671868 RepID=A0A2N8ZEA4_9VIBR|nr:protein of unknown function [Vibrio tapetis subsp. tapetis]
MGIQYNNEDICGAQFVCNELLGNIKLMVTLSTWLPVFWV